MTGTTPADNNNGDNNNNSCSALDLSWLSESVMEAALDNKNLSLNDVGHFHESLRAAEEFGSMEHDVSERLHQKIEHRKETLLSKMVAHETIRVTKSLGLFGILKTHKTWKQVHFMADMHGQGAYIAMAEFQGLGNDEIAKALGSFHEYLQTHEPGQLPFTPPEEAKEFDERARALVETKVKEKLCQAYRRLHKSLMDAELGGYKKEFLNETVLHTPEELVIMFGVTGNVEDDAEEEKEMLAADQSDDEV
ncbi:expressed unknown protein [Seminavis robusta]|uniref:Conserved Oligomeric Golgi complex subunit 6 C-terminal domain-containing protein n=1 Tax=Seminavis robusta TaxID=568900 RepID=A0A9N8E1R1_9STRA|nr:expressed unknown protein [Seminavis robusta]|eukprot:Sro458_g147140.1 n/a (250) ;mRNA; r:43275-44024